MDKHRLLKLAGLLEADAKNPKGVRFDLSSWAFSNNAPALNCGTSACAIGLAMLSPEFNAEGLTLAEGTNTYSRPQYGEATGWEAVERFFELDEKPAEFLFQKISYPANCRRGREGERAVAKRIRDFVAGKVSPAEALK